MTVKNRQILNGFAIFRIIHHHLRQEKPLSLVRLGDGEGALLGYPKFANLQDVSRVSRIWFGKLELTETDFVTMSEQLKEAVRNADIVGLPRQGQVAKHHLYAAVLESIDEYQLVSPHATITDAAIHRYLQFSLLYRALLKDRSFLGIISSRDITEKLSQKFNVEHIDLYKIKGENKFPGNVTEDHYPAQFEWLKANIKVPFQGALFMVGAGALGKIYCDVIKQKGGIALDVGAIFDAWAGVKSRLVHPCHSLENYQEHAQIDSVEGVARYNRLLDEFNLDTPRATVHDMQYSLKKW